MEQYSIYGVMETRDHFKSGVSQRSLVSRENIRISKTFSRFGKISMIVVTTIFFVSIVNAQTELNTQRTELKVRQIELQRQQKVRQAKQKARQEIRQTERKVRQIELQKQQKIRQAEQKARQERRK